MYPGAGPSHPKQGNSSAQRQDTPTFKKVATKWQEQRKSAMIQQLSFNSPEASTRLSGAPQPLRHTFQTLWRWMRGETGPPGWARRPPSTASVVPVRKAANADALQALEAAASPVKGGQGAARAPALRAPASKAPQGEVNADEVWQLSVCQ